MVSMCVVCVCVDSSSVVSAENAVFIPRMRLPGRPTERGLRRLWRILTFFGLVCGVMTAVTSGSKLVWLVGVMCMFVLTIRALFEPRMLFLCRE